MLLRGVPFTFALGGVRHLAARRGDVRQANDLSEIGTGTSYINIDGDTGIVVPPGDPRAFGGAMRRLWDEPALARAMGRHAEARYWSQFTAAQMSHRYCLLYSELAARNGSPVCPRARVS